MITECIAITHPGKGAVSTGFDSSPHAPDAIVRVLCALVTSAPLCDVRFYHFDWLLFFVSWRRSALAVLSVGHGSTVKMTRDTRQLTDGV